MPAFRDIDGRTWDVAITIATVKRVRDRLRIDLVGPDLPKVLQSVFGDPVTLCDVLFVVVQPQADRDGITDEQFGRAMAGDAIEEGAKALLAAIEGFTPNPRDRARVGQLTTALMQAAETLRDQAEAQLPTVLAAVRSGAASTSSPASSASSPAP